MKINFNNILNKCSLSIEDPFVAGSKESLANTAIIVIATFLLITFGVLNLFHHLNGIKIELSNKVNLFAELAVHTLQEPMWNYDTNTIASIANAYFKDKEVKLVEIKNVDGSIIYSKNGNNYNENKDNLIIATLPVVKNGYDEAGSLINNQPIGNIKIGLTDYYQNKRLVKEIIISTFILIFAVLLAIFAINTLFEIERVGKKRLSFTLNNMMDTVLVVDKNFVIKNCNNTVKTMFGYQPCELLDSDLSNIFKKDEKFEEVKLKLKEGSLSEVEIIGIKNDNSEFPIEFNIKKMDDIDELLYILVVRDITQRYEINKLKNEFLSVVSHELRTPLTSIIGGLKLILSGKMGEVPAEINNLIKIANNNSANLLLLINDILDVDKLESDKVIFHMEAFNISESIRTILDNSKAYAEQFNVSFNFIPNEENLNIYADKDKVAQVLTNLLSNATKFSKQNGEVKVYCQNIDNESVKVFVEDKGTGIPEKYKATIFEKFIQVDSSTTRKKGGTGLGLTICKALIQKMNGKIDFTSVEGEGSTFYFELPMAKL